ncbi:MAG TPA: M28 family peptidase [candidate division Zixibacteria bacterium]|nr:M28 family peptidase [candidate division Zixibacteria bacterium]
MIAKMKSIFFRVCILSLSGSVISSCSEEVKSIPEFNPPRAFEYLMKQVEFGPRVPGTEAWKNCRAYYVEHFKSLGLKVDSQAFEFLDPFSARQIPLVNVIAKIEGESSKELGILLMAHYDSRPRTDFPSNPEMANQPISGANDGASGAAVLMEMANHLSQNKPPYNIELVLVDGEDWGETGDNDYYLLGSREFARGGIRNKYQFAIVIDLVGDSDQQIYREVFSQDFHPELNNLVWNTARELGVTTFIDSTVHMVLDDHASLATSGVPAIDIIDFDYKYWHTDSDLVGKCSAQSLGNVGKVLLHICYNPSIWPKKK